MHDGEGPRPKGVYDTPRVSKQDPDLWMTPSNAPESKNDSSASEVDSISHGPAIDSSQQSHLAGDFTQTYPPQKSSSSSPHFKKFGTSSNPTGDCHDNPLFTDRYSNAPEFSTFLKNPLKTTQTTPKSSDPTPSDNNSSDATSLATSSPNSTNSELNTQDIYTQVYLEYHENTPFLIITTRPYRSDFTTSPYNFYHLIFHTIKFQNYFFELFAIKLPSSFSSINSSSPSPSENENETENESDQNLLELKNLIENLNTEDTSNLQPLLESLHKNLSNHSIYSHKIEDILRTISSADHAALTRGMAPLYWDLRKIYYGQFSFEVLLKVEVDENNTELKHQTHWNLLEKLEKGWRKMEDKAYGYLTREQLRWLEDNSSKNDEERAANPKGIIYVKGDSQRCKVLFER